MATTYSVIVGTTGACIADANLFSDNCKFDNTMTICGVDAGMDTISEALLSRSQEATPDDIMIFYFAGHTRKMKVRMEDGEESDGMDEVLDLFASEMSDNMLTRLIQQFKCPVALVLDSCFSASLIDKIESIESPEVHCFCSSQEWERSYDNRFTPALVAAMKAAAPSLRKTYLPSGQYLIEMLIEAFDQVRDNWPGQMPIYITNTNDKGISVMPEKNMPVPTTQLVNRKNQPLNYKLIDEMTLDIDGDGVPDSVSVHLWADVQSNHLRPSLNTGYTIKTCDNAAKSPEFSGAAPEDCLAVIRSFMGICAIKLIGETNMEINMDNISVQYQTDENGEWKLPKIDWEFVTNKPTEFEIQHAIFAYFRHLNLTLLFKGEPFDFGKVRVARGRSGGSGGGGGA